MEIPAFQVGNEKQARRVVVADDVTLQGQAETVVNVYVQRFEEDDRIIDANFIIEQEILKEVIQCRRQEL